MSDLEPPLVLDGFTVKRVGRCSPTSKSHIIATPGDGRALCNAKVHGPGTRNVGITWAKFVQAHIDGHDPEWCERCLFEWSKP